jgi:hypothetical protein
MPWINSDGLVVKFGNESARNTNGGQVPQTGPLQVSELQIVGDANVPTTQLLAQHAGYWLHTVTIPRGALIEKVDFTVEQTFTSGGAATLDAGLMRLDRTAMVLANGLFNAIPLASLVAGATIESTTPGVANGGASINTITTVPTLITYNRLVANYTAGRGVLRVYWYMPTPA